MTKKEYAREYYQKNKKKLNLQSKNYINTHKEQQKEYYRKYYEENKDKAKEYQLDNKDKINDYNKVYQSNRKKTDINYRIACNLRCRLNIALKGNYKAGSAVRDLGCSIEDFKDYIEWNFKIGMAWSNYGYWHLDHIKPLSSFNLTNREEFLKATHYTNLQPLWAEENISKGDKKYEIR